MPELFLLLHDGYLSHLRCRTIELAKEKLDTVIKLPAHTMD